VTEEKVYGVGSIPRNSSSQAGWDPQAGPGLRTPLPTHLPARPVVTSPKNKPANAKAQNTSLEIKKCGSRLAATAETRVLAADSDVVTGWPGSESSAATTPYRLHASVHPQKPKDI